MLRLIQIGDIHFSDASVQTPALDWKDSAFPTVLGKALASSRTQSVMRALIQACEKQRDSPAGILICGDLTDKGNLCGYEACLDYLAQALRLGDGLWNSDQLHAVPGNHDIDRGKCDPSHGDLHLKFDPLIEAWARRGFNILAARHVRHTCLSGSGHTLDVFSLNSCIGCGEHRSLPTPIKDKLHDLLYPGSSSLDLVWEQMDTPAFLVEDIDEITGAISRSGEGSLAVVVAHHNLLPQATPRLEIYTEVINGGLVRSRLSQCAQPIIYCHGHIHDDPVEVVGNPRSGLGRLVSISVPEFVKGFNVIEVHYSREEVPIGCRVVLHRIHNDGEVREVDSLRIPLRTLPEAEKVTDRLAKLALQQLAKETIRFDELRTRTGSTTKPLAHALMDLEWFDLVKIFDRQEDPKYWQVQRTIP